MSGRILVADDDPFNLRLLTEVCEAAGYEVMSAADGEQALAVLARDRPDLILLDVAMPGLSGFEVLRILKEDDGLASIPVVLVTATGDIESRHRGLALGAEDYITKPYRIFEVQQRIRNALRVRDAESAAEEAREQARDSELVDPLTHAGTPRQLVISLDYEHARAVRYGHALTCVVVVVANFRDLTDHAGREAGEGVLVHMATALRQCVRSVDHLFRSDLEEFTLLLPETDREGARIVLDRIESRSADGTLYGPAVEPAPRMRLACATWPDRSAESGDALRRAVLEELRQKG